MLRTGHRASFVVVAMLMLSCTAPDVRAREEAPVEPQGSASSGNLPAERDTVAPRRPPRLSPLADSFAQHLVFTALTEEWFVAAVRAKRLLVDIGRVDASVRKPGTREIDSVRIAAFRQAVMRRSPMRPGDIFRLRGPWGAEDATIAGFDWWNGRIVATLALSPRIDSIVQSRDDLVAAAQRTTLITAPVTDTCVRDSVDSLLVVRADSLRDSLRTVLLADSLRIPMKFRSNLRTATARVAGCFGTSRMLVMASLRAPRYEYLVERAVLLDSAGTARPLRLMDYRFRAHDPIISFDADGDGIDDLATRGYGESAGATTILRLNGNRLERVASGFAWEGL